MSILNRLNRIIRSNINDVRSGGQSGSVDSALGEMESSLKEARRQKALIRKEEAKLAATIRDARDKADSWEERAMLALKRGEEDLAREALLVRNEALDEAARLREELEEHRMYLQDIESALEALEMKMEGTRGRLRASSSSSERPSRLRAESDWDAELRRRVEKRGGSTSSTRSTGRRSSSVRPRSSSSDPFGDERVFEEMDRMSDKIDDYSAEVEAMRELSDENLRDPGKSRLEERFRKLEGHEELERTRRKATRDDNDDLADLKKKFED
ncbi:MAG: PspA/IM30 family protein [Persicimonas sp.]